MSFRGQLEFGLAACALALLAGGCNLDQPRPGVSPLPTLRTEPSETSATAVVRSAPATLQIDTTASPIPGLPGLLRLTNNPANDSEPAWSPDGERLAFSSNRDGSFEIFVMKVDGAELTQLTMDEGLDKSAPDWSPDGAEIAFETLSDVYLVYAFNVQGSLTSPFSLRESAQFPLTNPTMSSSSPAWSPDGSMLLITAEDANGDWRIFQLSIQTGVLQQLTHGSLSPYGPTWSPDGRRIAFVADLGGENFEIFVLDDLSADGGNPIQLTDDSASDGSPNWSPDGRYILFNSNRAGSDDLYLMRADGSDLQRLTFDPGYEVSPIWSPDGRYIAFVSDRDGNSEIYRMDAPTLEP